MTSKINPFPVRMPPALRARVQDRARGAGKSEHATILALIEAGLGVPVAPPTPKKIAAPPSEVGKPISGAKLDTSMVPQAGTFEAKPLQKSGAKRKWALK